MDHWIISMSMCVWWFMFLEGSERLPMKENNLCWSGLGGRRCDWAGQVYEVLETWVECGIVLW